MLWLRIKDTSPLTVQVMDLPVRVISTDFPIIRDIDLIKIPCFSGGFAALTKITAEILTDRDHILREESAVFDHHHRSGKPRVPKGSVKHLAVLPVII